MRHARTASRTLVQGVARFLLQEHGREWARDAAAALAYFTRNDEGAYLVLRDARIMRRLASVRILLNCPQSAPQWKALRRQMMKRGWGPDTVWHAKYTYLVVPDDVHKEASRALRGTRVRVLSNRPLERPGADGRSEDNRRSAGRSAPSR